MTLEELKKKIDEYIGLTSTLEEKRETSTRLVYYSPTQLKLFDISIGDYDNNGNWEFGGNSGAITQSWTHLCHIHEEA